MPTSSGPNALNFALVDLKQEKHAKKKCGTLYWSVGEVHPIY